MYRLYAVSYTHLDVYKRQEYLKKKECYPQLLREHQAIIEAIEKSNKETASEIMGQHIENQVTAVTDSLRHK